MHSNHNNALLADTAPSDWQYVAEGGATMVFSYTGAPHPRFSGYVLRMHKVYLGASAGEAKTGPDAAEFHRTVIECIVDPQWLPKLESVPLDRDWVESFARVHDTSVERPAERRQAQVIDVGCKTAVLATDLVGSERLAVEIKPKWAFLPNPRHLSRATFLAKTRTCRFCMHAHTKDLPTAYCPLGLFSSSPARLKAAIGALWDAWIQTKGAANTLRVFVYGKVISPANTDTLRDALGMSGADPDTTKLRDAFIEMLAPILLDSPVLRTISHLQRSLDALDIEGIVRLGRTFSPPNSPRKDDPLTNPSEREPSTDTWADFLEAYLTSDAWLSHVRSLGVETPSYLDVSLEDSAHSAARRFARETIDRRMRRTASSGTIRKNRLRYHILAYLLSVTFKDCSVMIHPLCERSSTAAASAGCITIIDLELKSIHRLDQWAKLDQEIATSYATHATGSMLKRCIPGGVGSGFAGDAPESIDACSIHWLPSELLAHLFGFYVLQPHSFFPASSIALSHVCKHWRDVSLSVPALWSQLTFRFWHMRDACADLLQDLLDRSRGLSLSLALDLGEYAGAIHHPFMHILGGSTSRARHISITAPFADFVAMSTDINLDGSLRLESAEIIVSDVAFIAEYRPRGFMEEHFGLRHCPSLRHCRIQGYRDCTHSLLHNLNPAHLETLDIRHCTGITWNAQLLADRRLEEGITDDRTPLFQRLQHLNLQSMDYDHPDSEIRLVGSSLLSLKLTSVLVTKMHAIFADFFSFVDGSAVQELQLSGTGDRQRVQSIGFLDGAAMPRFPACQSLTMSTMQLWYMNRSSGRSYRTHFTFPALTQLKLIDVEPEPFIAAFEHNPLLQDIVVVHPLTEKQSRAIYDSYYVPD